MCAPTPFWFFRTLSMLPTKFKNKVVEQVLNIYRKTHSSNRTNILTPKLHLTFRGLAKLVFWYMFRIRSTTLLLNFVEKLDRSWSSDKHKTEMDACVQFVFAFFIIPEYKYVFLNIAWSNYVIIRYYNFYNLSKL